MKTPETIKLEFGYPLQTYRIDWDEARQKYMLKTGWDLVAVFDTAAEARIFVEAIKTTLIKAQLEAARTMQEACVNLTYGSEYCGKIRALRPEEVLGHE